MINWFARNGVAANLLMLVICVGGLVSMFFTTKVELFPEFSLDAITVRVPFRGAAPEEVEANVIKRIEERIQDLQGIKKMTSVATEGLGTVTVEVQNDYDARKLLDDIKVRVDAIDTFPEETEKPIVEEILIKREVIAVAVYGETSEGVLKRMGEEVRNELLMLPGVTQVEISGIRDYEISIEVSEEALRRYGLTFDEVVQAVRRSSLDMPGGRLRTEGGEILLRTMGQAYVGEEFENIVLLSAPDGTRVRLGDVATVVDGFEDVDLFTVYNDMPAVMLMVFEVGTQSPLEISDLVKKYVADKQFELPEGMHIDYWRDSSFYLWGRLNMLIENGVVGLLLVFAVLTLFLRPSLAVWVTLGIPISFLGTFLVMPWMDVSLNLISLFGFILVLGIVVDDAIVVGESVFTTFQREGPGVESAVRGTQAVSVPVTFAVLTTAVAFTPLLNLPGFLGKFVGAIPLVIIPTLLFSLIESKLILPYHLSLCRVGDRNREKLNWFQRMQRSVSDGLERHIDKHYRPVLRVCLEYRYLTISGFVGLLVLTIALLAGGWVKRVEFPNVPSDYISTRLVLPDGTSAVRTEAAIEQLRRALEEAVDQSLSAGRENPVENTKVTIGQMTFSGGPGGAGASGRSSNIGEIVVELRKSEDRSDEDSALELANRWRAATGVIPGVKELTFNAVAAGGQGMPIDVQVSGGTLAELRAFANELKATLVRYDGIYDIRDNLADSQKEIKLDIKPSAEVLGLSRGELGNQVRQAFFGAEAQRIQRGRDDVRVMVRYPEKDRQSLGDLENMRVRTPDGREVPFSEVAEAELGRGYAAITRVNRERVVNVYADADKDRIDLEAVRRELREKVIPELLLKYPALRVSYEGEAREVRESNVVLLSSALLVLFAIYALLAIPFKSYLQPLIVMSVIPFGLCGAVGGHVFMGLFRDGVMPVSRLSLFGMLALAGVVVNDSLVLVDYINQQRARGVPLKDAVREAGAARFRPIMLTSLTTFVGLVPILLEKSLQAQFMIPMAVSLSFGIVFATFITLLLVPAVYIVLEDIKALAARVWRWLNA
ncbi:efflux RND transporter permease subunit [Ruficoccus amylovorans]|uniref:Efflux RND transporter permease subunit n=1 Tax=Ruficoccus amylovorans TaxID=1804625 RepID=A0A842HIJ5_9BACT|nr:efflux RND transporter permease subunit [Ruficoccus amylovorans]MBC2595394.1 efflux RND transporter permease subunit [Ruficoccus amylovorans]